MKRFISGITVFTKGLLVTTAVLLGATTAPAAPVATPTYTIQPTAETPSLSGHWHQGAWKDVPTLDVAHFYRTDLSSGHRPETQAKVIYDAKGLYIHFRVEDRYVRAIETEYHGKVWEDACVEFFVEPVAGRGYFNFEINCGGTMLLSYKENPDWTGPTLRKTEGVPWELAQQVKIFHTMPKTVEPEITEPVTWQVEYFIPFTIFEAYLGDLGDVAGQTWRANFYKCAENNSHPHWASWSLITKELNFHQPEFFSEITFKK
jgi:hypothetical protein